MNNYVFDAVLDVEGFDNWLSFVESCVGEVLLTNNNFFHLFFFVWIANSCFVILPKITTVHSERKV